MADHRQVRGHGDRSRRLILVNREGHPYHPWVVATHFDGDEDWEWGHYFRSRAVAWRYFLSEINNLERRARRAFA